jgi:nucleoside phosphorylase
MTAFITALPSEAQPLIKYFKLILLNDNVFKIYKKDNILLIVSGIGKEFALMATAYLFAKYKIITLINIGIAGADKRYTIGDMLLINKIYDVEKKRFYFPQMRYKSVLKEASLHTFCTPVDNAEQTDCVDMEASAIFFAASKFLKTSNIVILKVVSDHFSTNIPLKTEVHRLIENHLSFVKELVEDQDKNGKENNNIEPISTQLKLTKSQKQQLKDATIYHRLHFKKIFNLSIEIDKTLNKHQRKEIFKTIIKACYEIK